MTTARKFPGTQHMHFFLMAYSHYIHIYKTSNSIGKSHMIPAEDQPRTAHHPADTTPPRHSLTPGGEAHRVIRLRSPPSNLVLPQTKCRIQYCTGSDRSITLIIDNRASTLLGKSCHHNCQRCLQRIQPICAKYGSSTTPAATNSQNASANVVQHSNHSLLPGRLSTLHARAPHR